MIEKIKEFSSFVILPFFAEAFLNASAEMPFFREKAINFFIKTNIRLNISLNEKRINLYKLNRYNGVYFLLKNKTRERLTFPFFAKKEEVEEFLFRRYFCIPQINWEKTLKKLNVEIELVDSKGFFVYGGKKVLTPFLKEDISYYEFSKPDVFKKEKDKYLVSFDGDDIDTLIEKNPKLMLRLFFLMFLTSKMDAVAIKQPFSRVIVEPIEGHDPEKRKLPYLRTERFICFFKK